MDVGPRVDRQCPLGPPPVDARCQELVGTGVADLTLDLRALDEPARLGMQRAAAGRHVTVAAGTQHVEDGIRGTRLRDREPDPHGAGLRLLDQLEAVAEVPADGAFEVGDEAKEVALRHGVERLPAASPERHRLEEDLVVGRPVGVGVAVDERHVAGPPLAEERVIVEESGKSRRRARPPRTRRDEEQRDRENA